MMAGQRVWVQLEIMDGYYCVECSSLCRLYEQGLTCNCGRAWESEVIKEKDYPEKWEKVFVTVEQKLDDYASK